MIGTVCAPPEVMRVRGGTVNALFLQVRFADAMDIQTVQYMPQGGEDTVPIKGTKVAVVDIGGVNVAVSSYDTLKSVRGIGEKEFYSSEGVYNSKGVLTGVTKLARFILKSSGLIYIGSTKNSKNLYDAIKALADAVKTLAGGNCVNGSPLTTAPTAIANVNTMISDLQKILTNEPGDN